MPQPARAIEDSLASLLNAARSGALSRRACIARLGAAGIAAPLAALLLTDTGVALAQPATYKPTKRGGGGALKLLFWQGPTLLNPHFATGDKDMEACRPFYEPLVRIDPVGNLIPILAAEVPSRANGGVAADGKSVLWKLKPGVKWHDGQPFTADDVVFNWRYARDPDTAAFTVGYFEGTSFEKVDPLTVRVRFDRPTPYWPGIYSQAPLIAQHLFKDYAGAKSREAPNNLKPVGTGPYRFVEFKPGDLLRASINTDYHQPLQPHFDTLELKGGGDAVSAARAVLQTGEYDYAWFLLVEDEVLKRLENAREGGGKGRVVYAPGNAYEALMLNQSDPGTVVQGERGHVSSRHPILGEAAVRDALKLLVDRKNIENFIYGRSARATANVLNAPEVFRSQKFQPEFNVEKANALLDAAGWKRPAGDAAGVREKAGRKLSLLFQTSINAPRQKIQQIVKQAAQKAGIDIQLKTVAGSTFFSSDIANPDTAGKFWADLQMYERSGSMDPARLMEAYTSWNASQKANKWTGLNVTRWRSAEYDSAYKAAATELDAARRAALFIRMNDLVCAAGCVIPIVHRFEVGAQANKLSGELSGWDHQLAAIASWHRDN